jgi:hypothetical protein
MIPRPDLAVAVSVIAESMGNDEAGAPLQRLGWLIKGEIGKAEAFRGEIFHLTHSAAYPGASTEEVSQ